MARSLLTFALAALAFFLAGCGGSSYEGDWTVDAAELKSIMLAEMEKEAAADDTMTEDMKKMMTEMAASMAESMKMNLTIKPDGTFTVSTEMMGQTDTVSGTWKAENGGITLTDTEEGMSVSGKLDGAKLVMTFPEGQGGPEKLPMVRVKK